MSLLHRSARQSVARTLTKTALYRVLMVLVSTAVAFAVTGRVDQAVGIGLATNLVKTATYFGYDRVWARIAWGDRPASAAPADSDASAAPATPRP